jgi:quinol monooxygenase YgiN
MITELFIFVRIHAKEGCEAAVASALAEVVPPSSEEPGCLSIGAFGSIRDGRLFYIHSRWVDEPAFDNHARLPHTERFMEKIRTLIDHPFEVTRSRPLG